MTNLFLKVIRSFLSCESESDVQRASGCSDSNRESQSGITVDAGHGVFPLLWTDRPAQLPADEHLPHLPSNSHCVDRGLLKEFRRDEISPLSDSDTSSAESGPEL